MSFRPVNDEELLQELDKRTEVRGSQARVAATLDIDPSHLRQVISGTRSISLELGSKLGYELRWVKK